MVKSILLIVVLFFTIAGFKPAFALQADEILLIVNKNFPVSTDLANYYRDKRQIPATNLLTVNMTKDEDCSRKEYQQQLLEPLRQYLDSHQGTKIRCLLLFYGIPLRVAAPELSRQQMAELADLQHHKKRNDGQLKNRQLTTAAQQQWQGKSELLNKQIVKFGRTNQRAAVDSEISLALIKTYPLENWQLNPYFVGFRQQLEKLPLKKEQILFVSRLDGSTPEIVRRMIDDSLYAEQHRLQGRAYFDARWPLPTETNLSGYASADASIHKAAELTDKLSSLPVHLDQRERLLQPGEAPQAALYCGWYSLGKYVDAFAWQRGAVGYHIASSEAITLKTKGSQVWCKRMLEDGVAATVGPVAEPYVQGFPVPELFFRFLLDGYYTLVESYFFSIQTLSWQMILLGDPLYRPFRNIKTVD